MQDTAFYIHTLDITSDVWSAFLPHYRHTQFCTWVTWMINMSYVYEHFLCLGSFFSGLFMFTWLHNKHNRRMRIDTIKPLFSASSPSAITPEEKKHKTERRTRIKATSKATAKATSCRYSLQQGCCSHRTPITQQITHFQSNTAEKTDAEKVYAVILS